MVKLHYGGQDMFFDENDILTPGKHYLNMCQIRSDINEHLPTLKRYSEECDSITEMGVRFACSTWAFIEARPKKLTSYDINYNFFEPSEKHINSICESYNIDFKFIKGDSLKLDIEKTDLLFIDTLHRYDQLISELKKHSVNVNKYIALHDTTTFAYMDESLYDHASELVKDKQTKVGLKQAVDDFLKDNKEWQVKEVFTNNNGLTILERI